MPDTPEKLAEHYRKLAAEEVAMAKVALTTERKELVREAQVRTRRRPQGRALAGHENPALW